MNIIRWKCGCVQMQDEPIFFNYCEGDAYTDYRLNEYIFDVNDRVCMPPFEIVSDEEKKYILKNIAFQSCEAYTYRKFKQVLKDMVK